MTETDPPLLPRSAVDRHRTQPVEDLFRATVEALDEAVYVCNGEHRIEYANPAMHRLIGNNTVGKLCHQAIHGRDTPCPWCVKSRVIEKLESNHVETTSPQDGRHYSITNAPLRRPNGTVSKLAIYRDVTATKQLQAALEEQREFSERLVDSSAVPTFVLDADHRILLWNQACTELTGLAANTVLGTQDHWRAFYPEPRRCLADYVLDGELPPTGNIYEQWSPSPLVANAVRGERWVHRPDGARRYVSFEAAPITNRAGRVVAVIETLHDITARRETEEEVHLLSTAVAEVVDGIAVTDTRGRVQYANPAFSAAVGVPRDRLIGENLPLPSQERTARAVARALENGTAWRGHNNCVHPDGTRCTEEISLSPVVGVDGRAHHHVVIRRDVTAYQEMERDLARAQQLEAIGTLASGIAHDFNNLLAGIIGHAELTQDDVAEGSTAAQNLERIVLAGERGQQLVQQLLAFGRHSEDDLVPISVGDGVREAVSLLQPALPDNVHLMARVDTTADTMQGDATQIQQVVMNLCTNAAYALGAGGGVVEVGLENARVDQSLAERHPELEPGDYLRLTVSDGGHGMTPEVLGRVFEPFFTTKPVGQGSGLGLAAVHGIVRRHGGAISVYSTPGEGTTFHLFFPCSGSGVVETTPHSSTGQCHVLFVDDEENVAELGRKVLEGFGYRVTATTSSTEALALLRAAPGEYDVLVTDHAMPDLTGLELTEAAMVLRPDLPVVLCSGYSQARTRERARELGVARFLLKPITVNELGRAVATVTLQTGP